MTGIVAAMFSEDVSFEIPGDEGCLLGQGVDGAAPPSAILLPARGR